MKQVTSIKDELVRQVVADLDGWVRVSVCLR